MKKFSLLLVFVLFVSLCSCHGAGKLVGFDVPFEFNENEKIEIHAAFVRPNHLDRVVRKAA